MTRDGGEDLPRLRQDYEARIIKPAIQEAVKAATARFTAEELITRRPEVRDAISKGLEERLVRFGIHAQAMSITDFAFSKSFNEAIEEKVTATQQVLKAERDLQRVRLEAQQQIEQARAQAEALRIQKENVTPGADRIPADRGAVQRHRQVERADADLCGRPGADPRRLQTGAALSRPR